MNRAGVLRQELLPSTARVLDGCETFVSRKRYHRWHNVNSPGAPGSYDGRVVLQEYVPGATEAKSSGTREEVGNGAP
jgi:hypothetical protein